MSVPAAAKVEWLKLYKIDTWSASGVEQLKPYIAEGKKRLSAVSKEKDKLVKELKEQQKKVAEIKSMSTDKLKKQKPAPESDFEVKPADDSFTGIAITKYKGKDPLVVIPATIQGLPVKRIAYGAFEENNNLVAVVIPEGVTYVGGFSRCGNLSSVVLPSTLVVIAGYAFSGCSSLKSIDLPEGLMHIDTGAFNKAGLTSVKLPKSLRYMDSYVGTFRDCDSLAEIQIPEDHAISFHDVDYGSEEDFSSVFSGTKINESIALQKLLKETKPYKITRTEEESISNEIAKKVGAKRLYSYNVYDW